ncbi:MAG: metal-dependent hydrolase [Candidatus Odinarchaeota archaeon]
MGSWKQHYDWAQGVLTLVLIILVYLLTAFPGNVVVDWLGGQERYRLYAFPGILTAVFLFFIGSVAPDMDLPNSRIGKQMKMYGPLLIGMGIGASMYVATDKILAYYGLLESFNFDPLLLMIAVAIVSGFFGIIIAFIVIWSPWFRKMFTHWGMTHSLVAAVIFSTLIGLFFWATWQALWGVVLGIFFFMGYLTHMVCDQVYHDLRDKEWPGENRYAVKILRNGWWFDPLILFNRFGPLQVAGEIMSDDGEGVGSVFTGGKKKKKKSTKKKKD